MSPAASAPCIDSQMPLWIAVGLFLLLPLSVFCFRAIARGSLAHFFPGSGLLNLGLVILTVVFGVGVVGAGYAAFGLFYFTEIDSHGIRQREFRKPAQNQVWTDLVSFGEARRNEWSTNLTSTGSIKTKNGFALNFKEQGRWSVTIYVWQQDFRPDDWHSFARWLKSVSAHTMHTTKSNESPSLR